MIKIKSFFRIILLSVLIVCILHISTALPVNVKIKDKQLLVNNKPFTIKGVCYAPTPVGYNYSFNWSEHPEIYENDLKLLKEMGANAIRIFCPEPVSKKFLGSALKNKNKGEICYEKKNFYDLLVGILCCV